MTKEGFEIRQTYFYDAPPEKVFEALTEPNQLVRWFLSKARVNLRKGGKIEFTWAGGHKMVGKVKRIVAGREVESPGTTISARAMRQRPLYSSRC